MFIYLWTWRRWIIWELHTTISTSTAWRWNASVTFQASASLHGLAVISVSGTAGLNGLRSRDMRQTSKDRNWMTGWIPRSLKITNPWSLMRMDFGCPWRIFFCRNLRQIMVMDGRVPKLVNLAAMNMVRSGGGKRSGTVGLIDLAETRGSLTMAGGTGMAGMDVKMGGQMVTLRVKAISGWKRPQMAMPTTLKDFQFRCRETRPWSQGVEGDGHTPSQEGAINAKVPGLLQRDPDPKACEVVKFGEPAPESEALASLAVARYAPTAVLLLPHGQHAIVTSATCHKEWCLLISRSFRQGARKRQRSCLHLSAELGDRESNSVDTSASHATARFQWSCTGPFLGMKIHARRRC